MLMMMHCSVEDGVDGAVHPLADSKWLSRFKWVSAARSQVHTELSPVVAGITDTEQVLACLHADILHLMVRLEVRVGFTAASMAPLS